MGGGSRISNFLGFAPYGNGKKGEIKIFKSLKFIFGVADFAWD